MTNLRRLTLSDWNKYESVEMDAFPNDPNLYDSFIKMVEYDGFLGLFTDDNDLIGYLYCRIYGTYSHLHRICVISTERGKKFGSYLFEKAISYFEERNCPNFILYVETKNKTAFNLYEKYGMKVLYESWHFILDLNVHQKAVGKIFAKAQIKTVQTSDFDSIKLTFPTIDISEIKGMLEDEKIHPGTNNFVLLLMNSKVIAFARFNKKFAGCRPFFISDLTYFDTFIAHLISIRQQDKNYVRITFDNNDPLAELCKKRNYTIHHHLYKMGRKT